MIACRLGVCSRIVMWAGVVSKQLKGKARKPQTPTVNPDRKHVTCDVDRGGEQLLG